MAAEGFYSNIESNAAFRFFDHVRIYSMIVEYAAWIGLEKTLGEIVTRGPAARQPGFAACGIVN